MAFNAWISGLFWVFTNPVSYVLIEPWLTTVNDASLVWLKFGKFTYFTKLSSSKASFSQIFADILYKIRQTLCCQIDCKAVLPNFGHAKLETFTVFKYISNTSIHSKVNCFFGFLSLCNKNIRVHIRISCKVFCQH